MEYRRLKPSEIKCRVKTSGIKKDSNGNKTAWTMLLLYKDARCDMAILDETFCASFNKDEKQKKDKHITTVVGKCPVCGGEMQMNEKGFIKCQNASCGAMFSRYYGRSLTVSEATSLFNGQEVELENLEYNGKTFTQKVSVSNTKDENNWIKLKKCS